MNITLLSNRKIDTRRWRDAVAKVLEWYIRSRARDITDLCVISFFHFYFQPEVLNPWNLLHGIVI